MSFHITGKRKTGPSKQIKYVVIGLVIIGGIVLAFFGLASQANQKANAGDQIQFVSSLVAGSNGIDVTTFSSPSFNDQLNDTLVVTTAADTGNVTTMTDSFGDIFIKQIQRWVAPNPFGTSFEVWTTKTTSAGPNQIMTTEDSTVIVGMTVGIYINVNSIGNVSSNISTASLTMLTAKSGSWVVGSNLFLGLVCPTTVVNSPQFIDRNQICTINLGPLDFQDNATVLRNGLTVTFTPTAPGQTTWAFGMIELIAIDQSPLLPPFNTFCTSTNGLCITTQYKLNLAGTRSAPNSGSQVLLPATQYCTGLTSNALTTSGGLVEGWSTFGANDRNVTGATMLVQFYISTVNPSQVFGVGLCSASGNTLLGTSTFTFTTQGIGAANTYGGAISGNVGIGGGPAANTYYGYVEVTVYNFGSAGHMLYLDSLAQVYSLGSCAIMEKV